MLGKTFVLRWINVISMCAVSSTADVVRSITASIEEQCGTDVQCSLQMLATPSLQSRRSMLSVIQEAPGADAHKVFRIGLVIQARIAVVACVIFGGVATVVYLLLRYREFVKEDMQQDRDGEFSKDTDMQTHGESDLPVDASGGSERREASGTCIRMRKLPPTGVASLDFRCLLTDADDSNPSASGRRLSDPQSTACESALSSASSIGSLVPPLLKPHLGSSCTWTIPYHCCQALVLGNLIEVEGSPRLHARLTRNGPDSHIEVGRIPCEGGPVVEAMIGPLTSHAPSGLAAQILGPDMQLYGFFAEDGHGFTVSHASRHGHVLTLSQVKTAKGSFLEIEAEGGHPICLARLNDPNSSGVEIDADPDVDGFLIVSCVLACFVARPELLADMPISLSRGQ